MIATNMLLMFGWGESNSVNICPKADIFFGCISCYIDFDWIVDFPKKYKKNTEKAKESRRNSWENWNRFVVCFFLFWCFLVLTWYTISEFTLGSGAIEPFEEWVTVGKGLSIFWLVQVVSRHVANIILPSQVFCLSLKTELTCIFGDRLLLDQVPG